MKKTMLYIFITGVAIFSIALIAGHANFARTVANQVNMTPAITHIHLGDPKDIDMNQLGASIEHHPTGALFYQFDWGSAPGTVEFKHGENTFVIDQTLSALGSSDSNDSDGIAKWNVNFRVSSASSEKPEVALDRLTKFFAYLKSKGWRRYIDVNFPRLQGKEAWDFRKTESAYSLDSSYTPTIEEWKSISQDYPRWEFYANGVYLYVTFMSTLMDGKAGEEGKVAYLMSVNMQSEYAFYGIGFFYGDAGRIKNWKKLLPAELVDYHQDRVKSEAELKAKGYTIDESYEDPPIKGLE